VQNIFPPSYIFAKHVLYLPLFFFKQGAGETFFKTPFMQLNLIQCRTLSNPAAILKYSSAAIIEQNIGGCRFAAAYWKTSLKNNFFSGILSH